MDLIQLSLKVISDGAAANIASLHKQRNALVSQPKSPTELITRVIALCVASEPYPLQRLAEISTVSTWWRTTIRDTPSLWTSIRSTCSGVKAALSRSKNSSLTVLLDEHDGEEGLNTPKMVINRGNNRAKQLLLGSQKFRCESLTIIGGDIFSFDRTYLNEPLPLLHTALFKLKHCHDMRLPEFHGGPLLRHLHLDGVYPPQWSPVTLAGWESLAVEKITVTDEWATLPLTPLFQVDDWRPFVYTKLVLAGEAFSHHHLHHPLSPRSYP